MPSNGWRTFVRPRDGIRGLAYLHRNASGLVTVWHDSGDREDPARWRLTRVSPDGAVRQATGRTRRATRNAVRARSAAR
jgi:hypothetical protein